MKKMTRKLRTATLGTLLLSLAVACQSGVNWDGIYTFTDNQGEDPGGAAMLLEYRLEIDGDRCEMTVTGYQANSDIRCTLETSGQSANIRFRSYGNGEVKNVYGVEVYKIGERLFTLRYPTSDSNQNLITEWGSLKPDGIEDKSGDYFSK